MCDLPLLRGQIAPGVVRTLAGRLAGHSELASRALGEPRDAHLAEHVIGRAQLHTGIEPTAFPSQPLAVQEVGPCEVGTRPRTPEALDSLCVERLCGGRVVGNEGRAAGLQAKTHSVDASLVRSMS